MQLPLLTALLSSMLIYAISGRSMKHVFRFTRQLPPGPVVPYNNDSARLNEYPDSPIEAFFGTGAHTHHLPTKTIVGTTNPRHTVGIGEFNIDNEIETTNDYYTYDHKVGGVDNIQKQYNVSLDQAFSNYKQTLKSNLNASGQAPHPYYQSPTHFIGHSAFDHDTGVQYQQQQTPLKGHHNIGGLKIEHAYQPSYPFNTYNHALPGVNTFQNVNWSKHFDDFSPAHANMQANLGTAGVAAVPSAVVNGPVPPQSQAQQPVVQTNPFINSNAQQPAAPDASSLPAATVGTGGPQPPTPAAAAVNPFMNTNPVFSRQRQRRR